MANLNLLIGQRKIVRKKDTECFNRSSEYLNLGQADKLSTKSLLLGYKDRLKDLNNGIFSEKFSGTCDETDLEAELTACQDYFDKIESCLPLLEFHNLGSPSDQQTDIARSLLK